VILRVDASLAAAPPRLRGYASLATAVAQWAPLLADVGAPVVLAAVARGRRPAPLPGRRRDAPAAAARRAVEQAGARVAATATVESPAQALGAVWQAQAEALFPAGPILDAAAGTLTPECARALSFVFRSFAGPAAAALEGAPLGEFARAAFSGCPRLGDDLLKRVAAIEEAEERGKAPGQGRRGAGAGLGALRQAPGPGPLGELSPNAGRGGGRGRLSPAGLRRLVALLVVDGRMDVVWGILRSRGLDDALRLPRGRFREAARRAGEGGQGCALGGAARGFLRRLCDFHARAHPSGRGPGVLSLEAVAAALEPLPGGWGGPLSPLSVGAEWGVPAPSPGSYDAGVTVDRFLLAWDVFAQESPAACLEALAWAGCPGDAAAHLGPAGGASGLGRAASRVVVLDPPGARGGGRLARALARAWGGAEVPGAPATLAPLPSAAAGPPEHHVALRSGDGDVAASMTVDGGFAPGVGFYGVLPGMHAAVASFDADEADARGGNASFDAVAGEILHMRTSRACPPFVVVALSAPGAGGAPGGGGGGGTHSPFSSPLKCASPGRGAGADEGRQRSDEGWLRCSEYVRTRCAELGLPQPVRACISRGPGGADDVAEVGGALRQALAPCPSPPASPAEGAGGAGAAAPPPVRGASPTAGARPAGGEAAAGAERRGGRSRGRAVAMSCVAVAGTAGAVAAAWRYRDAIRESLGGKGPRREGLSGAVSVAASIGELGWAALRAGVAGAAGLVQAGGAAAGVPLLSRGV